MNEEGDVRKQLDSITLERDLELEFEELIPDTLRSPPMDYPEMPPTTGAREGLWQ